MHIMVIDIHEKFTYQLGEPRVLASHPIQKNTLLLTITYPKWEYI